MSFVFSFMLLQVDLMGSGQTGIVAIGLASDLARDSFPMLLVFVFMLLAVLSVLVVVLLRVNTQKTRVIGELKQRIEERTQELQHSKGALAQVQRVNDALTSTVSKKLTAIAATLNGIQHIESTDGSEIGAHLAAIVDEIREVTRMLHKDS